MLRHARLLLLIAGTLLPASLLATENRATLVFSADMPVIGDPNAGAYPQLATLLTNAREKSYNTFFVFGGGSIGPSPMSAFDRGSHIIDILNSLEPDVMGVTKREFSYFEDELSLRSYEAAFPIVASNILDPLSRGNLNGLLETSVVEKGGFRVGFISILHESVIKEYLLKRIKVLDPRLAVKLAAEKLKGEGANVIVLLHSYPFPFITDMLHNDLIQLALLSDPHIELTQQREKPSHDHSVVLAHPGEVATVELSFDKDNQLTIDSKITQLRSYSAQTGVETQVNGYLKRLNRLLDEQIGELGSEIDTTRPVVRGQESAFGNFIADTMRQTLDTDIALINGGVIRGERAYSSKTMLSRRDIATELPFRSRVVIVDVTGEQLLSVLENGFSQIADLKGRFPQVSGFTVTYDSKAPVGQRVISVTINDKPLVPSSYYRMATSDYLASGGDGYDALTNSVLIESAGRSPLLSDIVINQIRAEHAISPQIEGRLIDLGGANE